MRIPDSIYMNKSRLGGKGLFAKEAIKKNTILFHFEGRIGDDAHTNPESLQLDEDKFLESTIKFDDFVNHSCEPNCYIDWKTLNFIALKEINKDEEITCDYCTFEYDAVNLIQDCSFKCKCGSKNCIKEMKGFKYLSAEQKFRIKDFISPFLKSKLEQELK